MNITNNKDINKSIVLIDRSWAFSHAFAKVLETLGYSVILPDYHNRKNENSNDIAQDLAEGLSLTNDELFFLTIKKMLLNLTDNVSCIFLDVDMTILFDDNYPINPLQFLLTLRGLLNNGTTVVLTSWNSKSYLKEIYPNLFNVKGIEYLKRPFILDAVLELIQVLNGEMLTTDECREFVKSDPSNVFYFLESESISLEDIVNHLQLQNPKNGHANENVISMFRNLSDEVSLLEHESSVNTKYNIDYKNIIKQSKLFTRDVEPYFIIISNLLDNDDYVDFIEYLIFVSNKLTSLLCNVNKSTENFNWKELENITDKLRARLKKINL